MRKLKLHELGRMSPDMHRLSEKIPVSVVLADIRSGLNVGSFFRTADAFRIHRIHLCGITCQPPHKEILKTAIGATESVDWSYHPDVVTCLRSFDAGHTLIGIEQTDESVPLDEIVIHSEKTYVLIFGNEVSGLPEACLDLLDKAVEIPQYGTKHSLNVAVCGGIVLWHFAQPFLSDMRK